MTSPLIILDKIERTFNFSKITIEVLKGISFTVKSGAFIAITGPSGSGKSTLMNIIGCIDTPTKGSYILEGTEVSKMDDEALAFIRNKKIGFVFQNFNLLPRYSALANVELPLFYAGIPRQLRKDKAESSLASVGLINRGLHSPSELSGGEKQRVAIARALVNNPLLILADEPTGNLDSKSSLEIMSLFQKLNIDTNVTIIVVTHDPAVADFAKRVITIVDGVIELDRSKR